MVSEHLDFAALMPAASLKRFHTATLRHCSNCSEGAAEEHMTGIPADYNVPIKGFLMRKCRCALGEDISKVGTTELPASAVCLTS